MEDTDTQELLCNLLEKAAAINRLNGFTLRRDQIAFFVEKVIEMEPAVHGRLPAGGHGSLSSSPGHRLKQLPYKIWSDQAREERDKPDRKDVGPDEQALASVLNLLKRGELSASN